MSEINYKYSEDKSFQEIQQYIDSTYGSHYVDDDSVQLMDLIFSSGDSIPFCRWNSVKYTTRYGYKEGYNRKDLLKAIHYLMFMLHEDRIRDTDELPTKNMVSDQYNGYVEKGSSEK